MTRKIGEGELDKGVVVRKFRQYFRPIRFFPAISEKWPLTLRFGWILTIFNIAFCLIFVYI